MKILFNILAACMIVMGSIWILQGVNILPGSFMTGQIQWAYRGGVSVVAGILLLAFVNRGRKRS